MIQGSNPGTGQGSISSSAV